MTNIEKENNELKELLRSFIEVLILTIEEQTDPYKFICDCITRDYHFFESKKNTIINIIKEITNDIEEIKKPLFPNRFLYRKCQELLIYLENKNEKFYENDWRIF